MLGNEEIEPENDPNEPPLQCMDRGEEIAEEGSGVNKGEFKLNEVDIVKEPEDCSVTVSPGGEVGESGR
jgi:hypothetical protein